MAGHGHGSKEWKRLGDGTLPSEEPGVGLGHIVSLRTYNVVFASLVALTIITVWAATHDFGVMNIVIAMLIATIKAGTVTLLFMHLKYENKLVWMIVCYPIFILGLMLIGTVGDNAVKDKVLPLRQTLATPSAVTALVAEGHH